MCSLNIGGIYSDYIRIIFESFARFNSRETQKPKEVSGFGLDLAARPGKSGIRLVAWQDPSSSTYEISMTWLDIVEKNNFAIE